MADGWKKRQPKEDESSFLMHGKESCTLRSMTVSLERWGGMSSRRSGKTYQKSIVFADRRYWQEGLCIGKVRLSLNRFLRAVWEDGVRKLDGPMKPI